MVKVLVNGIGVIGKRVAHAVKLQDDMELVGISDVAATPTLRAVLSEEGPLYGTPLYCSSPDFMDKMSKEMYVEGLLEDLLRNGGVDVVVDATPKGIDARNKQLYEKYGVKAIFQGGAKADIAEVSFNSFTNYDMARGKQFVRVVSCNTTSLARTLSTVQQLSPIKEAMASLVRRAVDPWNPRKGPINAIEPVMGISHHGPDLQTVMDINIRTMAVKVPTTLMHVHMINVFTESKVERNKMLEAFRQRPRIKLYSHSEGFTSTAEIIEFARDTLRPRYDHPWVAVWEESVGVEDYGEGSRISWVHAVHSESIVIPENIDAIRAVFGLAEQWESIKKTNESMGI